MIFSIIAKLCLIWSYLLFFSTHYNVVKSLIPFCFFNFSSLTVYFVMYRYTISCRICVVATRQLIKYLTLVYLFLDMRYAPRI